VSRDIRGIVHPNVNAKGDYIAKAEPIFFIGDSRVRPGVWCELERAAKEGIIDSPER
jgi:hypothetical protein